MSEELKPCPFCGRQPEAELDTDYPQIGCDGCPVGIELFTEIGRHIDKAAAIKAWNTRAINGEEGYYGA